MFSKFDVSSTVIVDGPTWWGWTASETTLYVEQSSCFVLPDTTEAALESAFVVSRVASLPLSARKCIEQYYRLKSMFSRQCGHLVPRSQRRRVGQQTLDGFLRTTLHALDAYPHARARIMAFELQAIAADPFIGVSARSTEPSPSGLHQNLTGGKFSCPVSSSTPVIPVSYPGTYICDYVRGCESSPTRLGCTKLNVQTLCFAFTRCVRRLWIRSDWMRHDGRFCRHCCTAIKPPSQFRYLHAPRRTCPMMSYFAISSVCMCRSGKF